MILSNSRWPSKYKTEILSPATLCTTLTVSPIAAFPETNSDTGNNHTLHISVPNQFANAIPMHWSDHNNYYEAEFVADHVLQIKKLHVSY